MCGIKHSGMVCEANHEHNYSLNFHVSHFTSTCHLVAHSL
jgi:hypothetical protein